MPTKKNFLGGQQNYDPNNGEYESSLVNSKGQVETDADGDGISHESKKKEQDFNDPSEAAYNKAEEKDYSEWDKVEAGFQEEVKKAYPTQEERRLAATAGLSDPSDIRGKDDLFKHLARMEPDISEETIKDFIDKHYQPSKKFADWQKKEEPVKKYSIGSDKKLSGQDREKMNQLVDRMKQEGLNVKLEDGYEDIGANMHWTAPVVYKEGGYSDGVWGLNPSQWIDYMNGDMTADQVIDNMKKDRFQKDWFQAKNKVDVNKKIKEQTDNGATENDLGYFRNVFQDIPGFNNMSDEELRKRIERIRSGR